MTDPFEYDVFLSFSSADETIVKPIWQELTSNGLRVFWSNVTLKKQVGSSWFEIIEQSLERSKHMILICSENAMKSKWVKREYRAFYDNCYITGTRRLIPLLTHGFPETNLPLFLKELQSGRVNDDAFIQEIIPLLGGVNIENILSENRSLKERAEQLLRENKDLRKQVENIANPPIPSMPSIKPQGGKRAVGEKLLVGVLLFFSLIIPVIVIQFICAAFVGSIMRALSQAVRIDLYANLYAFCATLWGLFWGTKVRPWLRDNFKVEK